MLVLGFLLVALWALFRALRDIRRDPRFLPWAGVVRMLGLGAMALMAWAGAVVLGEMVPPGVADPQALWRAAFAAWVAIVFAVGTWHLSPDLFAVTRRRLAPHPVPPPQAPLRFDQMRSIRYH